MPQREIEQLDKASIIRLTISTLKVRDMINLCKSSSKEWGAPQIIANKMLILSICPTISVTPQKEEKAGDEKADGKMVESSIGTESLFEDGGENMAMQALDGFLMVLSSDGDIVYVSENIHDYIGIQQVYRKMSNNKYEALRDAVMLW